jgi:hypothetical protein
MDSPAFSANPTLPSAKPSKASLVAISALSLFMGLSGIGLGASAYFVYHDRANDRLARDEQLTALEQNAEISQKKAQLQRGYDAPIWVAQVYDPTLTYEIEGTRAVPVPVLVGTEFDSAFCVGSMDENGFTQNPDDPLCLGY